VGLTVKNRPENQHIDHGGLQQRDGGRGPAKSVWAKGDTRTQGTSAPLPTLSERPQTVLHHAFDPGLAPVVFKRGIIGSPVNSASAEAQWIWDHVPLMGTSVSTDKTIRQKKGEDRRPKGGLAGESEKKKKGSKRSCRKPRAGHAKNKKRACTEERDSSTQECTRKSPAHTGRQNRKGKNKPFKKKTSEDGTFGRPYGRKTRVE